MLSIIEDWADCMQTDWDSEQFNRRVKMERCWFLGPTVISLGTLAQRYNVSVPWFERMIQSEAPLQELGTRAIPEQAVNDLVDFILKEQGLWP